MNEQIITSMDLARGFEASHKSIISKLKLLGYKKTYENHPISCPDTFYETTYIEDELHNILYTLGTNVLMDFAARDPNPDANQIVYGLMIRQ